MSDWHWRPATTRDLHVVAGWIPHAEALQRWAGPGMSWPTDGNTLSREIAAVDTPAFCLVGAEDSPVAFGQLVDKGPECRHLARIIVAPAQRGQALGERLCRRLLTEACAVGAACVTLNVFADNAPAVALYRRLGFVDVGGPDARGVQRMALGSTALRPFAASVDNADNRPPDGAR